MSASIALQIFTKSPQLGQVKTRLAAELGDERALALYETMLARVCKNAAQFQQKLMDLHKDVSCSVEMWVSGATGGSDSDAGSGSGGAADCAVTQVASASENESGLLKRLADEYKFKRCQQLDVPDLGERICGSVAAAYVEKSSVILMGGDSVAAAPHYLYEAYTALRAGRDVVIGPAYDGGYVLIGLNRRFLSRCADQWRSLFLDIPWGESQVMLKTLFSARKMGVQTYLLDTQFDVDFPEDLKKFIGVFE